MRMSPLSRWGTRSAIVLSTTAAGTINQTARGFSSFFTRSASAEVPTTFSLINSFTAFGDISNHALMASLEKPPHHVGSHPAKSDHSELHTLLPLYRLVIALRLAAVSWRRVPLRCRQKSPIERWRLQQLPAERSSHRCLRPPP